jgi:hypothetical protein
VGANAKGVWRMTLWFIGYLFTAGYTGLLKYDGPNVKFIGLIVLTFIAWPLLLGMYIGDQMNKRDGKDVMK